MPGWKTLESIYNESKSPKAYSDKPVSFNGEFNATQQNAIKAALNSKRQILCIGGPPGTGKTQILVGDESAHIDRKTKSHKEFKDLENRSSLISDFREKDVNSESIKDYCDLSVGPSYEIKKDNINNSQIIFITAGSSDMGLIKKAGFIPDVVLFEEGNRIMECVSWRFLENVQLS
uniref:AAA_11 domain-containing protein n=1 Tax=Strongyloides papillosus TaxID=174720 RepID=A0A0N5BBA3_STREA